MAIETGTKIKVPLVTISDEEVLIKDYGQFITLYREYAIIESRGTWKIEDPIKGKIQVEFDDVLYIHDWCPLGIHYEDQDNLYYVLVDSWRFYFTEKSNALSFFTQIAVWKNK